MISWQERGENDWNVSERALEVGKCEEPEKTNLLGNVSTKRNKDSSLKGGEKKGAF